MVDHRKTSVFQELIRGRHESKEVWYFSKEMNSKKEVLENAESISLEGLEEVFVSTDDQEPIVHSSGEDQGSKCQEPFPEGGLKLSEAADKYSVTERTIQRWIKEGRLVGHKVQGNHGPEWRVTGESPQDKEECHEVINGVLEEESDNPKETELVETSQQSESIERMASIIEKLTDQLDNARKELQGASFRNGYLEAQLVEKESHIKLLTDSQEKKSSAWSRFCLWFWGKQ